jgi:tetratricopeptide (TPR) repeat protein
MPAARLLLVTTARPEFAPGWLDADHTLGLHLERMADGQALAIVDGMLGSSEVLAGVRARIVERAEGIPLFVEELSQVVLDASKAPAEHAVGDIPASLQSLLLARLDRLGAAKPVAQVASVLGREFSHEMLLLVLGDEPDRRAGLDLERALGTLMAAGLLTRRVGTTGPTASYAFRHALLQDAAYQSLLRRTRRELHVRVVGVLRIRFPDLVEAEPELAARHAEAAGMAAEAIAFYERAAAQAEARSAHEEALLHLNRALDVALAEPAGVERDRRELAVRESMSAVLFRSRGWAVAESVASAARMRELALSTGDRRSYAAAVLGVGLTDYLAARFAPALASVEESIAVAGEVDATAVVIVALTVSANIAYAQGRFRDAHDFADRAASLYVPELHHREVVALAGDDSGVTAMGTRGWALFQLGYPITGIACTQSAVGVATSLGHPFTLAQARLWELAIRVNRADDDLEGMATDLLLYCQAQKFPAFAGAAQGILAKLTGDPALALEGVASAATTGSMVLAPVMGCYLAEAQLEVGQLADALASIDAALDLAAATVQPFLDGHMLALKGEAIRADATRPVAERRSDAESCFRRGIEIAGAQENRMFQLRAANCLARLLHGDGRDGEARALLAPLYGWFSEGFDTFDLRETRRLLAELGAT